MVRTKVRSSASWVTVAGDFGLNDVGECIQRLYTDCFFESDTVFESDAHLCSHSGQSTSTTAVVHSKPKQHWSSAQH